MVGHGNPPTTGTPPAPPPPPAPTSGAAFTSTRHQHEHSQPPPILHQQHPPPSAATATLHGLPPAAQQPTNRMLHHASHGCGLGAAAACWRVTARADARRQAIVGGQLSGPGMGGSHRLTVSASATRGIRRAGDGIRRRRGLFSERRILRRIRSLNNPQSRQSRAIPLYSA